MNTDYKSIGNGLIMLLALSMSLLAASTFWEGAQAYATAMWGGAVVVGSLAITQPRLSTILYLVGSVIAVIGALQLPGGGVYSIVLGLGAAGLPPQGNLAEVGLRYPPAKGAALRRTLSVKSFGSSCVKPF